MKKSIKKNFIWNLLYQILLIIAPIATTPYVSRTLGAESIGEYNYVYSIISYFIVLTNLGINMYGQREIAANRNDSSLCQKILCNIQFIKVIYFLITTSIFLLFISFVDKSILYIICYVNVLAFFFDITWFFQGLEEFDKAVLKNIIVKVTSILLIFLCVKEPKDLNLYALILGGSVLLGNLFLWPYIRLSRPFGITCSNLLVTYKCSLAFTLSAITNTVYININKTILGVFCSELQVGFYSQAEKIVKLVVTLMTALATVLLPRITYYYRINNDEQIAVLLRKAFNAISVLAFPMAFGIFGISDTFTTLFLGEEYTPSIIVMKILSCLPILMGFSSITGTTLLVSLGKQKEYNISITIAMLVNVIFSFLFIPTYGYIGAAVVTVITELCVLVLQVFFGWAYIKKSIDIKNILKILSASISMLFFLLIIQKEFNLGGSRVIISVILGILFYFAVTCCAHEAFLMTIFEQMKRGLSRK